MLQTTQGRFLDCSSLPGTAPIRTCSNQAVWLLYGRGTALEETGVLRKCLFGDKPRGGRHDTSHQGSGEGDALSHLRRVRGVQGAVGRAHGILQQVPRRYRPEELEHRQQQNGAEIPLGPSARIECALVRKKNAYKYSSRISRDWHADKLQSPDTQPLTPHRMAKLLQAAKCANRSTLISQSLHCFNSIFSRPRHAFVARWFGCQGLSLLFKRR